MFYICYAMKTNTSLFFYESSSCSIERDNSTKDNPTPSMFADYYPGEDGALKKCPVVIFSERASLSRGRMPRPDDGNTEFNSDSPYRYGYQGQERDAETGKEAFQLRLYDSRINRWLTTDPKGQYASPYMSMGNNWMNGVDPDGAFWGELWNSIRGRGWNTNEQLFNNEFDSGVRLDEVVISGVKNPSDIDPSTLGGNLYWSHYIGGNNPKTYDKKGTYKVTPKYLAGYPAIGHDRRYDNLEVAGLSGLFKDQRAIGADYTFVAEELMISFSPDLSVSILDRVIAGNSAVGLGLIALPKTVVALMQPFGVTRIIANFHISNHGVTNMPSK